MASLLDISNTPRTVTIAGVAVPVHGVSAEKIASLMVRFPDIGKAFSGMKPDAAAISALAPHIIAAVIAVGTAPEDAKDTDLALYENKAASLSLGDQADLLNEILRLTFPRGVGPFVKQLQDMGLVMQVPDAAAAPATAQPQTSPTS